MNNENVPVDLYYKGIYSSNNEISISLSGHSLFFKNLTEKEYNQIKYLYKNN